ncbi:hypothetical protein EYF80_055318 [Liparis tanakae]|uniref:Uncharacterized protein n=1 Tax=Liparis tanakae TaxID=230148 RepID=A0A4Z2F168_9TELE|nr:hypothetical protein EYF80_055318 [Liparis tanakae]
MSHKETVQVVPLWELSIPLPAVLMITLGLYMVVLGLGLWIRSCLKVGAAGLVSLLSCSSWDVKYNVYNVYSVYYVYWNLYCM